MSYKTIHHLSDDRVNYHWDRSTPPLLHVRPGEVVEVITRDASDRQLGPDSRPEDIRNVSFDHVNAICGPIAVEGARPGDVLQVEILDLKPGPWGWTGVFPGFGLLTEDFPEYHCKIWDLSERDRAQFLPGINVPFAPFCGVIGLAWDEEGSFSIIPPRASGGNMDIKHLTAGTTLYLPVSLPDALFSIGDGHAAQGDGEVCGTAIECPMQVALRFDIRRDFAISAPQFLTGGPLDRRTNTEAYYATTGIAPDLMEATRAATRAMIEHLGRTRGLSPVDAYMLCSIAVDLRINEVVDAPNWVVSACLPMSIFEE
jgi:acetamidase/formamidase